MEYRTHARGRSVRIRRNNALATAIVVILSVGLIAAIIAMSPLGTFLSDNVFAPLFQWIKGVDPDEKIVSALSQQETRASALPSAAPTVQPVRESVLNIDEKPFYILQMGVFTDELAAEEHAQEIRRMGAGGYVHHDNAVYRVFAAAYLDEESLVKVQGQVRSDGFEATPYITESARIRITLNGDASAVEQTEKAVSFLSEIPTRLSELSLSFDKGDCSAQQVKDCVASMLAECEEKLKFFEACKDDSIVRIRSILEHDQKSLSTFLSEYDTIESDECASALKHLQIETIIDYILFFDHE